MVMGNSQLTNNYGGQSRLDLKPRIGWLIIGIILIGANLRVSLTSVGPLIAAIRDDLGISNALAGVIYPLLLLI